MPGTATYETLIREPRRSIGNVRDPVYLWRRWKLTSEAWPETSVSLQEQPQSRFSETSLVREIDAYLENLQREENLQIENYENVQEYLSQFPNLMEVILIAVRAARKRLPSAQLILNVYNDPEIEDRYLVIYVRSPVYDDDFMNKLEEAEGEFINDLVDKEGWLQLSTDFRKPEAV